MEKPIVVIWSKGTFKAEILNRLYNLILTGYSSQSVIILLSSNDVMQLI